MRLIGICPECKKSDSLAVGSKADGSYSKKAFCESCKKEWDSWIELVVRQEGENRLIPVHLDFDGRVAALEWPLDEEIPFKDLVTTTLWRATAIHFGLIEISDKGIKKLMGKKTESGTISLIQASGRFGIFNVSDSADCAREIMKWFINLLGLLFLDIWENRGRGVFLKAKSEKEARDILRQALEKFGNKELAEGVLATATK